ncbi:MAG: hypothetical protein EAX91_00635 [Candidatus Lokiarchaeota archaeon]|nr:hypothetical protein [Candidatus Lokiarchaeota archaeon]
MRFIIDGEYQKELISRISRENLPVSHIIVHVPLNPFGNGSIFLPKVLPNLEEFEKYTKLIQDYGITPIAGIDSTCQGNLEAHIKQNSAYKVLIGELKDLGYKEILVSSPNNVGFLKANFPTIRIYLAYSQYVTSLNRAKIFFELGADSITLHPDVIRSFYALENFIKLKEKWDSSCNVEYILPLNIGCNWGCIQWFQHHNLQSHRTIASPLSSEQQNNSDIEDAFDYPLLYCWRKRLEKPVNFLKAGWISPDNIELYENIGYSTFLLLTGGFSVDKIVKIVQSYTNKSLNNSFNEFLNIPQPYGAYWSKDELSNSILQLEPEVIKEFNKNFPYYVTYLDEREINHHCLKYVSKLPNGSFSDKQKLIQLITNKLNEIEKGAVNR